MLATAATWIYILLIAFIYGFAITRIIPLQEKPEDAIQRPLAILVWLGLIGLTCLGGALSLVTNLGWNANLIVLAVGLSLGLSQRKAIFAYAQQKAGSFRQFHWLTLLAFAAIITVILLKSTQLPQNYDTGLYHAQAIRWMETYPAVPGLGNLNDRLVFNSNLLVLQALFSFSFISPQSLHTLNALLALLLCAYALGRFNRLLKGELTLANLLATLLPFLLRRIFSLELSSPGTDLPAALIVWTALALSLEKMDERADAHFDLRFLAVLALSLFAVTVKLSTLPILLLPLYFFLRQSANLRRFLFSMQAMLAVLILLPWAARSLVQSGYLVYPVPQTAISHPDWQIPADNAQNAVRWIQSWAKIATPDREAVEQMNVMEWVPIWFDNQVPLDRQILAANAAALVMLVLLIAYRALRLGLRRALFSPYAVLYGCVLLGILYWFLQAPAMRFGYAFLASFPALCVAPFLLGAIQHISTLRRWAPPLLLVALALYQGVSLYRLADPAVLRPVLLFPVDYPRVPVQAHTLGDLTLYTPQEGDQCWYEPFPCVPSIDAEITPRGSSLADGFRVER